MCGRYFLQHAPKDIRKGFFPDGFSETHIDPFLNVDRFNIAPSQQCLVVRNRNGQLDTLQCKWGFHPRWLKATDINPINARGETIFEKPMFKSAAEKSRCIVPASGWYEWQKVADGKQPWAFHLQDFANFGFAGLWTQDVSADGEAIENFLIITTEANPMAAQVHQRMPVILTPEGIEAWLSIDATADDLKPLIQPYQGDDIAVRKVSRRVNSPKNDGPDCLDEISA